MKPETEPINIVAEIKIFILSALTCPYRILLIKALKPVVDDRTTLVAITIFSVSKVTIHPATFF